MTCNNTVTIWHYDEETGVYTLETHHCWAHGKTKIVKSENGMVKADECVIRIPTRDDIIAAKGDYIKTGTWSDVKPPKESCLEIAAIADNRIGSDPHWRIDAI